MKSATRGAAVACVVAGAIGCDDSRALRGGNVADGLDAGKEHADAAPLTPRRICDGSSSIRLAVRYQATTNGLPARVALLGDLGFEFLFVDGSCRFWVRQPGTVIDEYSLWRPYRQGTLASSLEASVHLLSGYDDMRAAIDCRPTQASDIPALAVWDGEVATVCHGDPDLPRNWPLREQLYAAGTNLEGPVRLQVNKAVLSEDALIYEWPLDTPIGPYVVESDEVQSRSFRIEDSDSVSRLRALRDRVLADAAQAPVLFPRAIAIKPSESYLPGVDEAYLLVFRDELPFADSSGKWNPQ